MSAVFDTLKMNAMLYREGDAFTTTQLPGLAERSADITTASAGFTLLNQVVPVGESVVVAYGQISDDLLNGLDLFARTLDTFRVVRSNNYVVRLQNGATTMVPFSKHLDKMETVDEPRRPDAAYLRLPREKIHSFQTSLRIADLPQKPIRIRLISRSHGEDDA